jgi:IstB-like ATP binding protein
MFIGGPLRSNRLQPHPARRMDVCRRFGIERGVAAAMIDRLVHHTEVVSMKGDSYRLKDRDLWRVPSDDAA